MVAKIVFLFVVLLLTMPLAGEAQRPRSAYRIGWLTPVTQDRSRGFPEALRALGYVDGQTVLMGPRAVEDDLDRL